MMLKIMYVYMLCDCVENVSHSSGEGAKQKRFNFLMKIFNIPRQIRQSNKKKKWNIALQYNPSKLAVLKTVGIRANKRTKTQLI